MSEQPVQEVFDLTMNRFRAARRDIDREPCLRPLKTIAWTTTETISRNPSYRWRDMGNGVLYMTRE